MAHSSDMVAAVVAMSCRVELWIVGDANHCAAGNIFVVPIALPRTGNQLRKVVPLEPVSTDKSY